MHVRMWLATALALLATLGATARQPPAQPDGLRALDGEWVYVEDRTEGRANEQQGPNTGPRIRMRGEKDAVVLVRSDGEIPMALDGSPTDVVRSYGTSRYRGEWKDGAYVYEVSAGGQLSASIGYMKGGTPQRFEFGREGRLVRKRAERVRGESTPWTAARPRQVLTRGRQPAVRVDVRPRHELASPVRHLSIPDVTAKGL